MSNNGFFAVDIRRIEQAARIGLNPSVSYLILAAGTGADQSTTSWSVNAIEKYTGISRGRSQKGIKDLIAGRLVDQIEAGSKPRYKIKPWADQLEDELAPMKPGAQRLVRAAAAGEAPDSKDRAFHQTLVTRGFLESNGDLTFQADPNPKWAWIPQSFVIGAGGETPPLERLRRTRDVKALQLAIDLYYEQQLAEHGGIPRSVVSKKFERHKAGDYGAFTIWHYEKTGHESAWGNSRPIKNQIGGEIRGETVEQRNERWLPLWHRLKLLENCGVLEYCPCLVEGEDLDAEIIHPISWGSSDSIEDQLGRAIHLATMAVARKFNLSWAETPEADNADIWMHRFVVAPRNLVDLRLFGIARLRYRAHTAPTSAWWSKYQESAAEHLSFYRSIRSGAEVEEATRGSS